MVRAYSQVWTGPWKCLAIQVAFCWTAVETTVRIHCGTFQILPAMISSHLLPSIHVYRAIAISCNVKNSRREYNHFPHNLSCCNNAVLRHTIREHSFCNNPAASPRFVSAMYGLLESVRGTTKVPGSGWRKNCTQETQLQNWLCPTKLHSLATSGK